MGETTLGSIYAIATALVWAVAVVLFKRLGETLSPVVLNLFKNLVALLALGVTLPLLGHLGSRALDGDAGILFVSGVLGMGIADVWLFAGLNRLGASLQAVADGLYAPIVMLWSYALLGEHLTGQDAVGGALVIGSLLLVAWPGGAIHRAGHAPQLWQGLAYSTAAIVLMGFSIVWIKPLLAHHDIVHATMLRTLGGVAFLLVYLAFDSKERAGALRALRPSASWRRAVPACLLGSHVAVILWLLGFKYAPASVAAILNQTSVLFIALLAAIFLKEPLTLRSGMAVCLGFAGSALVLAR